MPDDPAFIRAIAASPDDDAPRLVYADYLDETGDPAKAARAEFIRVQIEKARLVPDTPRWTELWHRDTALLEWARQWRAELPAFEGAGYGGFIRGFVDQVEARDARRFLEIAPRVFDRVPTRLLQVSNLSPDDTIRLSAIDRLSDIVELRIWIREATVEALESLSDRGPWQNLRRLTVHAPAKLPTRQFVKAVRRFRTVFAEHLREDRWDFG